MYTNIILWWNKKSVDFVKIQYQISTGGPPVGKAISLQVIGSNDELRTELTNSVEAFLASFEGFLNLGPCCPLCLDKEAYCRL